METYSAGHNYSFETNSKWKLLLEHIKKEKVITIENAFPNKSISWDEIIPYFQECADNVKGNPINILSYQLPNAENIIHVKETQEYLQDHLEDRIVDADMFLSFTKKTTSHPPHKDDHNTLLWVLKGSVGVNIYASPTEFYRSVKLKENDLLFLPHFVYHEIVPTEARALVSFGLKT